MKIEIYEELDNEWRVIYEEYKTEKGYGLIEINEKKV